MYEEEPLKDYYTLMDIAYIYTWRRVNTCRSSSHAVIFPGAESVLIVPSLCFAEWTSSSEVSSSTDLQKNEDQPPERRLK